MKIHLSIEADSVQEYQDALASLLFTPPAQSHATTIKFDETDLAMACSKLGAEATEKVIYPEVPAKEKPVKPAKAPKEKPTSAPAVEPVADPTPEEQPAKKAEIDIDALRELAYPLNTGGEKTKAALKGLLAEYGAKALGEISVDDYTSLQAAMLELHKQFHITI